MQYIKKNLPRLFRFTLILGFTLVLLAGCSQKRIPVGSPTEASLGSKVAQTATMQIGKPYRMGGSTPQRGFDCSGLVFWAYGQHGIHVPRATTEQAKAGTSVSRLKLIPGDIVVFKERSGPNHLHTGIYTGNNSFVHSPNSRSSVRMDSLTSHWQKVFINGRRIVN